MTPPGGAADGLREIPGGWTTREMTVGGCRLQLTLPAAPDAFLDDPQVRAANDRDDFMPYWAYLWPAAVEMAECVAEAGWPPGTRVLEIGAGLGLVGLAALCRGWDVTFSDYAPSAVEAALSNARANGFVNAAGVVLDWRRPPDLTFPVVLGCDVIYEPGNHPPILALLERVLAPGGAAWLGDPGRQHAPAFLALARQRGFTIELRDEGGQPLAEPQLGRFQLVMLGRRAPSRP